MKAKIYQPAKNAMQSGRGRTREWLFEYEPQTPKNPDALMGWTTSRDTKEQIKLTFPTREAAVKYAENKDIPFEVIEPKYMVIKPKSYADNFSFKRKRV